MGVHARRHAMARMTPSERFDTGLQLSARMAAAVVARAKIPDDLPAEERRRRAFLALREASQ